MGSIFKNNFVRRLIVILALVGIVIFVDNATTFLRRAYPVEYYSIVEENAKKYKIDPYLVMALIKAESGFNKSAESDKDAKGLMQLTDETAFWAAEKLGITGFNSNDLFEPETNIELGCWYLNELLTEFENNSNLALASYNAGRGTVKEWVEKGILEIDDTNADDIPYNETRIFVKRVLNYLKIYHNLYN